MSNTDPSSASESGGNEQNRPPVTAQPTEKSPAWWLYALLALVVLAFLLMRGSNASGVDHPGVGSALPTFKLDALTESATTINSQDLKGRVVLVNFWATWCGPCRVEFPHLVQLNRTFGANPDFRMVSVSCPGAGTDFTSLLDRTESFLRDQGADFPVHVDAEGTVIGRVAQSASLPSTGIPLTIVLDRDSIVRGVWQGYAAGDERDVSELISQLISH